MALGLRQRFDYYYYYWKIFTFCYLFIDYSMLPYPSVRPDSDSEEVLLDPIFQDGDFEMLDNAEVNN